MFGSWKGALKFVGMVAVAIVAIRWAVRNVPDSIPGAAVVKSFLAF